MFCRNQTRQNTDSWGTGAMTTCPCCRFSVCLPLKEIWKRPLVKGVAFAESNRRAVCLPSKTPKCSLCFTGNPKVTARSGTSNPSIHWNQSSCIFCPYVWKSSNKFLTQKRSLKPFLVPWEVGRSDSLGVRLLYNDACEVLIAAAASTSLSVVMQGGFRSLCC